MKKDLILNRKVILINGVIFAVLLGFFATWQTDLPPRAYAGFSALMLSFLPAVMVTREDKFNAMVLGCSLPVSRKTIVRARFVLWLGLALAGVAGAFALGAFLPSSNFVAADLFTRGPILTALTGVSLLLALLLPFTLRFGMKGVLIFLASTQVLGVILLTVMQMTRSSLDRALVERILGGIAQLQALLGPSGFDVLLVALLVGLLGASYLLSVRVFEGREL